MATKTIDELKKIFESEDVYFFKEQQQKRSKYDIKVGESVDQLTKSFGQNVEITPKTKIDMKELEEIGMSPGVIYKYSVLSPESKEIIKGEYDFILDDKTPLKEYIQDFYDDYLYFKEQEHYEDYEDPTYEDVNIYRFSKYYEFLISEHLKCVYCDDKLHAYVNPNMPCVDLMCENVKWHKDNNKPCFYQVKISKTGNYFSVDKKFISVGSRKYGEAVHSLTSDNPDFYLIPNYICILVDDKMKPVKRGSFALFYEARNGNPIFSYDVRNNLIWSDNVVYDIDKKFENFMKNISIQFESKISEILGKKMEIIDNPFTKMLRQPNLDDELKGGYYYKYLKYKTKYNNLKKQLIFIN